MNRRCGSGSMLFVVFGVGMLADILLPSQAMVVVLGIALVLCGWSCVKHR